MDPIDRDRAYTEEEEFERELLGRIEELEAALTAEREACAKLVEEYGARHREHFNNETSHVDALCDDIAEAIRSRDASASKDKS